MSVAAAEPSAQPAAQALTAAQEAFVRAELIRRLFEGSAQSRYFSFVLWPVIAAIYWRQIDLMELLPPFLAHIAVTLGFDVLRRNFTRANPPDADYIYQHTEAVGFVGASSIERLATEPAIQETTAAFKKLRLRPR